MAQLDRMTNIPRQPPQKTFKPRQIFFHVWRQLPKNRSDTLGHGLDAAEELIQSAGEVGDALDMRDEPAPFHGKDETRRRFVAPAFDHLQCGQPVKRRIDFDRGKLRGVKLELLLRRHVSAVKELVPAFVNPTTRADENFGTDSLRCVVHENFKSCG